MQPKEIIVYMKCFPKSNLNELDHADIIKEMEDIAKAETIEKAMDIIRWWDCWEDDEKDLRRVVRKIRKLMKEMP
mgnify:FL=1